MLSPATASSALSALRTVSRRSAKVVAPSSRTFSSTATSSLVQPMPTATPMLVRCASASSSALTRPQHRGQRRPYATSPSATSSPNDPAEEESQRFLEEGTTHLESGDLEKAKAAYKRSLEIKRNSSALFNLGVCHYHDRDLAAAIEAWNESLRLSPESADAHTNLASAYVLSKPSRPDLAVDHLKTAATITPDDPEIQYNLAAVLEACEQLEEALTAYKRALDGGIQRAEQNIRNCSAKILGAKVAIQQQQEAEEEERKRKERHGGGN
ncbi:uncharacterized protein PFL1_00187 [Pseudozyma flocculosa PF-1]|uniref:TPR-like protein n=1 Tax=Pseudozyma flocculosa TaxID=84751 RepID=A0A5C3ES59_9BASI|nr:uncharacterized protein PFL1_00187 [Pseudozyma flocculosa PF-1]EPQ31989.1 hypothetical protein PFL1_00187 [Pseudozyma flocculosa PF-1]SPO35088.1 uncharacterized protein PSFLO_00559 [Pseudozyma flocculosa]